MKIITKTLIILSVVLLSTSISVKRTSSSSTSLIKRSSKSDGSGSWADGFECPGLLISNSKGELQNEGKATFKPVKLEAAVTSPTAKDIGWVFEFPAGKAPGDNLKKVMHPVNGKANHFYIPFRYISGTFSYTNPWFKSKYVEGVLTNDGHEQFNFKLNLPYKVVGNYIDDKEGTKIANLLNQAKSQHQTAISSAKTAAKIAVQQYLSSKSSLDHANKNGTTIEETKNKMKVQIDSLAKKVNSIQTELSTFQSEIYTLEKQLGEKKAQAASLAANLDGMKNAISSLNKNMEEMGKDSASIETLKKNLAATLKSANEDLDKQLAVVKAEAPEKKTEVEAAKTAVINTTPNSEVDFNTNIQKVFP